MGRKKNERGFSGRLAGRCRILADFYDMVTKKGKGGERKKKGPVSSVRTRCGSLSAIGSSAKGGRKRKEKGNATSSLISYVPRRRKKKEKIERLPSQGSWDVVHEERNFLRQSSPIRRRRRHRGEKEERKVGTSYVTASYCPWRFIAPCAQHTLEEERRRKKEEEHSFYQPADL